MQTDAVMGYQRLTVWKEAHKFVLEVYKTTRTFPKEEFFGITSQMRRATVSIAANIVEGQTRKTKNEFLQFLFIANGSLVEVEYYLRLTHDLGFLDDKSYQMLEEKRLSVGRLLHAFISSIKKQH